MADLYNNHPGEASGTMDNEQHTDFDSSMHKIDRRYRESQYFLADQLRHAEAVNDFRSIKQALLKSTNFSLAKVAFQFARVVENNQLL